MLIKDIDILISSRKKPFTSINELYDAGLSFLALERLADADTFTSIGLDRRKALWEVTALHDNPLGLFKGQPSESKNESPVLLPEITLDEQVVYDYSILRLSLKAHPVSFLREKLKKEEVVSTRDILNLDNGDIIRIAGEVLVRQRPGAAGGVCFITIEDEEGNANLIVFIKLFENIYRKEILKSKLLMVQPNSFFTSYTSTNSPLFLPGLAPASPVILRLTLIPPRFHQQ